MAVLKYKTFWIALAIISIILFHIVRDAVKAHHRMMFSNLYATHSMGFLPEWQPEPLHSGGTGHAVAVDKKLNIFLCVFNDEAEKKWFYWGQRDRNHASLIVRYDGGPSPTDDMYYIDTINRVENRLIVIDLRNKTRFEAELQAGEANQLFDSFRSNERVFDNLNDFIEPRLKSYGYPDNAKTLPDPKHLPAYGE